MNRFFMQKFRKPQKATVYYRLYVERYLKHELRLRMDEEFDCYEVDVSEESTA